MYDRHSIKISTQRSMPFTSGFMLILHFDALLMEHVHVFQHRTSAVVYGSVENTQRRQPKHDRTGAQKNDLSVTRDGRLDAYYQRHNYGAFSSY